MVGGEGEGILGLVEARWRGYGIGIRSKGKEEGKRGWTKRELGSEGRGKGNGEGGGQVERGGGLVRKGKEKIKKGKEKRREKEKEEGKRG